MRRQGALGSDLMLEVGYTGKQAYCVERSFDNTEERGLDERCTGKFQGGELIQQFSVSSVV